MRIACIHIPQFALQCATRLDPALRGAAVAVVGGVEPGHGERSGPLHAPVVVACSRAAWGLGVRLGMTAAAARRLSAAIEVVSAEPSFERETVRALGDALLELAPVVDLGGRVGAGAAHLAMYAEVPAKTRGASFGDRLIERLAELGLTGRIGIADDRFTAWVAAAYGGEGGDEHGVIAVPRGGSAAFLSPRPLSLLAITPEVQHMLEALGVRTLGEFAALPAPSVARPLEADYQALARGESGTTMRPYLPETPIREEIVVSAGNVVELADLLPAHERAGGVSGSSAIALIARRIAQRLAGRGRAAARLDVMALTPAGAREVPVTIDQPLSDAEALARVLAPVLEAVAAELPAAAKPEAWRLRVVVAAEAIAGAGDDAAPSIFALAEGTEPVARIAPDEVRRESIDTLAVVLATTGSLFTLAPPDVRAERRDAHRRTRRGKQRRGRPTPLAQARLFDERSEAMGGGGHAGYAGGAGGNAPRGVDRSSGS